PLPLCDLGDCDLPPDAPPRIQLDAARDQIRRWWHPGLIPFMLGGDHTATVPVIEAIAPAFPDLRVLQLDAHPDTREEFLGERYTYASAMARVMEVVPPERVYQVGMRTGSREEFERARPNFFPLAAGPPRRGHRLRHGPAPAQAGRARLSDDRPRPLAREHRVSPGEDPRRGL